MSAPQYPINTIDQIADIPEEALPRFFAELPALIAQIKAARAMVAEADKLAGGGSFGRPQAERLVWVDDEAGTIDTTVTFAGRPDLEINLHQSLSRKQEGVA